MLDLDTVWVTGAGTGIGRSIVLEFLNKNCTVIGSSRNESNLTEIKNISDSFKERFIINPLDIRDLSSIQSSFKKLDKKYKINCLINNAGITSFSLTAKTELRLGDEIIKTNLLGSIYTTQMVLPSMIKRKKGTIINILSVAAQKIFTESSYYSASKAGLQAFMKVLREEVREHNIRIINIYPGATKTPIWPEDRLKSDADKMMSPESIADLIYKIYDNDSNMVPEEITLRPVTGDL